MALTDQQRKFVEVYVDNGGNGADAARKAGYAQKTARQEASRQLRNPCVLEGIKTETLRHLAQCVPVARKILYELATSSTNEKVRFDAAQALLDRGGLQLSQKVEHTFKDERTDDEIEASILALSKEAGIEAPEVH